MLLVDYKSHSQQLSAIYVICHSVHLSYFPPGVGGVAVSVVVVLHTKRSIFAFFLPLPIHGT